MLPNRLYRIIWADDAYKSEYVGLFLGIPTYFIDIGVIDDQGFRHYVIDRYEDPLPRKVVVALYSHCVGIRNGDFKCNQDTEESCEDMVLISSLDHDLYGEMYFNGM